MKVRAIEQGFYKGRRRKGQVFELPDTMKLGKWMELVEEPTATPTPSKKGKGKEPKVDDVDLV